MNRHPRGFTLIELLVVIAIIGLLSSIVLASLSSARGRGYDAKRVENMNEIQKALELFELGHSGKYPSSWTGTYYAWNSSCSYDVKTTQNNVIPGLVSGGYIAQLPPADPQQTDDGAGNVQCCYMYKGNGTDYKYIFYNCPASNACYGNNIGQGFLDPATGRSTTDCAIYTPGGAGW